MAIEYVLKEVQTFLNVDSLSGVEAEQKCLKDLLPKLALWICQRSVQLKLKSLYGENLKQSSLLFESVRQEMHVIWSKLNANAMKQSLTEIFPETTELVDKDKLESVIKSILNDFMPKIKSNLIESIARKFTTHPNLASKSAMRGRVRAADVCETGTFMKHALDFSFQNLIAVFKFQLDPRQRSASLVSTKPQTPVPEEIKVGFTKEEEAMSYLEKLEKKKEAAKKLYGIMSGVEVKRKLINPPVVKYHELQANIQKATLDIQAKLNSRQRTTQRNSSVGQSTNQSERIINTEYLEQLFKVSELHNDKSTVKLKAKLGDMRSMLPLDEYNKQFHKSSYRSSFKQVKAKRHMEVRHSTMQFRPTFALFDGESEVSDTEKPKFYAIDKLQEPTSERYKYCSACLTF